jgi:hypothetical protein
MNRTLVLQKNGEKHLKQLISTLDKVNKLLQRNNFSGVYNTSLHFPK